jgi:hypothetical protein
MHMAVAAPKTLMQTQTWRRRPRAPRRHHRRRRLLLLVLRLLRAGRTRTRIRIIITTA